MIFQMTHIQILQVLPVIIIAISIHEFGHAWSAYLLGDSSTKLAGRLSLNPLMHIDIIGLLVLLVAGFGWGKPVEFNPNNFKHPRISSVIVALAGPLANFILAFLILLILIARDAELGIFTNFTRYIVLINVGLGVFNLIPIYPLDGSHLVVNLFPLNKRQLLKPYIKFGPILLLGLIIGGRIFNINLLPISAIINTSLGYLSALALGLLRLLY